MQRVLYFFYKLYWFSAWMSSGQQASTVGRELRR